MRFKIQTTLVNGGIRCIPNPFVMLTMYGQVIKGKEWGLKKLFHQAPPYTLGCCCLPTPTTLGGIRSSRLWFTSQLLHPSGQWYVTPTGSVQIHVVRMWAQLKRLCVSCVWVLQRGNSGDGCDLASTLYTGDLFVLSWARV